MRLWRDRVLMERGDTRQPTLRLPVLVDGHEREKYQELGRHVVDRVQHLVAAPVAYDHRGLAVKGTIHRRATREDQERQDHRGAKRKSTQGG